MLQDVFTNFQSLNELTTKTTDDHIAFYKNKQNLSISDLFDLWKKLSCQAETFDKHDWTQNWKNWHKNMPGFIGHKYEAKFLIQWYLSDVLEELITKLIRDFADLEETEKTGSKNDDISEMIKREVKHQIKVELSKQKKIMN